MRKCFLWRRRARILLGLALALTIVCCASAQERKKKNTDTPLPAAPTTEQRDLFLNPGGRLLLPGFRIYDEIAQDRSDSIMALNMQFTIGTSGGEGSLPEAIARFVLQQALQFGYQYARERVRAQSLSEMDYLSLPQGPGMIRNFNEVGFEARLRGEAQSSRVWRDYLESRKNKVSSDK